jgi:hypothetical protein
MNTTLEYRREALCLRPRFSAHHTLTTSPLAFARAPQTTLFRITLAIPSCLLLVRWAFCGNQWDTGDLLCPTREPTGTDLLSSVSLPLPLLSWSRVVSL